MQDIAQFEARRYYLKYHQEMEDVLKDIRKKEERVDAVLAFAGAFFLTTWALVALRAYGIWGVI